MFTANNKDIRSSVSIVNFEQVSLKRSHSFGVSIVDLPVGEYW